MKQIMTFLIVLNLIILSSAARGASYNISPGDLTTSGSFSYDTDSLRPVSASGAPSGYGDTSFYASVTQGAATAGERYRTLRLIFAGGVGSLFGRDVAIQDLASISYYTDKPAVQTEYDWHPSIYTARQNDGFDLASWYRDRIQAHAPAALSLNAPANQWNQWTTATGPNNQLQFYASRTGFTTEDIAWSDLAGGSVTRGSSTFDFSDETILFIDISMGANSQGGTGASQLDGVRILLTDGSVADINLIPEPATMSLLALGGLALIRRRRTA